MATTNSNSASIGFEQQIWGAADILRGNMDAAEYKHVVLGLIFLKYCPHSCSTQHRFPFRCGSSAVTKSRKARRCSSMRVRWEQWSIAACAR